MISPKKAQTEGEIGLLRIYLFNKSETVVGGGRGVRLTTNRSVEYYDSVVVELVRNFRNRLSTNISEEYYE